jgi:transposase
MKNKPWTLKEEKRLVEYLGRGHSKKDIAEMLCRSESAIINRVQVLRERSKAVKPNKRRKAPEAINHCNQYLSISLLFNVVLMAYIVLEGVL